MRCELCNAKITESFQYGEYRCLCNTCFCCEQEGSCCETEYDNSDEDFDPIIMLMRMREKEMVRWL